MHAAALDWLAAITLVGVVEAATALSFLPAYRHDWRRWTTVDWKEFGCPFPAVFLSGALWFVLQLINSLGLFFILRAGSGCVTYHVTISLWVASFGVYTLWAIPWEMELPFWTLACWALSLTLTVATTITAWITSHSRAGPVMLSIYAFLIFGLMELCPIPDSRPTRLRVSNPFAIYFENYGWPILYPPKTPE